MDSRHETEFVGLLYDAALGRNTWQSVVAEISTVIGDQTSSLIAHDPLRDKTTILGMHCLTDDYIEVYGSTFFKHDLWTQEAVRRRLFDRAALGVELVSDRDWERSVIYNEFLRPRTDAFHLVGGMVHLHGGGVLAVGCHRPRSAKAFSSDHQALLDRLLPHFQRSVEVHQRLSEAEGLAAAAQESLDTIVTAMVQLNDRGKIIHLNTAAEAIFGIEDGLQRANGGIRAASHMENKALGDLGASAARMTSGSPTPHAGAGGHLRVSRPSGKRSYVVAVSPLGMDRESLSPRHPAVLILINDPDHKRPIDTGVLCQLHGLSPAEARVAASLATGQSLRETALHLDVSINTVRTLLARAMTKTETNSQLGLVRLVLCGLEGAHPITMEQT